LKNDKWSRSTIGDRYLIAIPHDQRRSPLRKLLTEAGLGPNVVWLYLDDDDDEEEEDDDESARRSSRQHHLGYPFSSVIHTWIQTTPIDVF
jgi:hypothetical protein